jgi:hypothetical protein
VTPERIQEVAARLAEWRAEHHTRPVAELIADARAILFDLMQARAALEFYAEGGHYWRNAYHEPRIKDLGEYAKKALGWES